ncbi:MAG: NUDIX hydrolase [Bacteroidota bacterium]
MNFCSNCGHPISFRHLPDDHLPRYVCDNCGTIHYQNPKIVTGCLPVWEDKVLLCRRAIEPRRGYWNVPAGYMENGETAEEGAKRELWEEACAQAEITGLHLLYDIPQINQVYLHFLGKLRSLDYKAGVESLEVKLFTESEIPWDEIAFTSSSYSLKRYFEDRKNGFQQFHRSVYRK